MEPTFSQSQIAARLRIRQEGWRHASRLRDAAPAMLDLLIEHSGDPDALCSCDDCMVTPPGTKCLNCRTKAMIELVKGGA